MSTYESLTYDQHRDEVMEWKIQEGLAEKCAGCDVPYNIEELKKIGNSLYCEDCELNGNIDEDDLDEDEGA